MTSKIVRSTKTEAEIEKCREESNWKRVIELAEQQKYSRNFSEILSHFLIGEGKLETFMEEYNLQEPNFNQAKETLAEAKRYLELCSLESSSKVFLDALLLLAKLEFACGNYERTLALFDKAGLQHLAEKPLSVRSIKIIAESYSIKGLCIEKCATELKNEDLDNIIRNFELGADLALCYLQEQDKLPNVQSTQSLPSTAVTSGSGSPLPTSEDVSRKMSSILETALKRVPTLYLKQNKIDRTVARFRSLLMAVEVGATKHLRLTLARHLSETLLRNFSETSYFLIPKDRTRLGTLKGSELSPWKPKRYLSSNIFIPQNINEEILLLLLVCETVVGKEAILSQFPEFDEARVQSCENAAAVYDLLTLVCARKKQFQVLLEVFERAMKFSFESSHVWHQFGLALACCGKNPLRTARVVAEGSRINPQEPHLCLVAAKVCFQSGEKINEGLEWAEKALKIIEEKNFEDVLASRTYVYIGIGELIHMLNKLDAGHSKQRAFNAFISAQELDPWDHLVEFYLGLYYALTNQLSEAAKHVKIALQFRPEHASSLLLLILVLSAQKKYQEAFELSEVAAAEYPEHLQLLYVKACLEEEIYGPEAALLTARHMLTLWSTLYREELDDVSMESPTNVCPQDNYSIFNMSERDGGYAESIAASRIEQALSEVASSLSSYSQKKSPKKPWLIQIQIWLMAVRLYLKCGHMEEAANCVLEAATIYPLSHHIMYMQGQICETKGEQNEALLHYQNALSINPFHAFSLRQIARVLAKSGKFRLAEKALLDAIKIDPLDQFSWSALGETTASLNHLDASSKCFAVSLQIEAVSPLLPFTSIPFCFE